MGRQKIPEEEKTARKRAYMKKYYLEHRGKKREYDRQYWKARKKELLAKRKNNPALLEYYKEYRRENRERLNAYHREYNRKRKEKT